ncbi:S1 family peptidase [Methylomonas sp. MgM2]
MESFQIRTCEAIVKNEAGFNFKPLIENRYEPFLVQDPWGLRKAIVPIFRRDANGELYGMGTAFHVDGWGTFLTADHVIDFLRNQQHSEIDNLVLFLGLGLIFGTVPVPPEAFLSGVKVISALYQKDDPMSLLRGESSLDILADLAVITAPIQSRSITPHTVPVKAAGWNPTIGETVLAVGFPELDCQQNGHNRPVTLSEGMYGAYGKIIKIYRNGVNQSRPNPVFEVECNWPSGMSGGPVFNSRGEVIGLVSRSLLSDDGSPGVGWATSFGFIPYFKTLAPTFDCLNPMWRQGWAVRRNNPWHLAGFFKTELEARELAQVMDSTYQVKFGSSRFGTDDFISDDR